MLSTIADLLGHVRAVAAEMLHKAVDSWCSMIYRLICKIHNSAVSFTCSALIYVGEVIEVPMFRQNKSKCAAQHPCALLALLQ